MKKTVLIRRVFITLLATALMLNNWGVLAEDGLLPSFDELAGTALPSLSAVLHRYPDSKSENADGSITEAYKGIYEDEYNAFSVYLKEKGAEIGNHSLEHGVLTAELNVNNEAFIFVFDRGNHEAKITYPEGTCDEWINAAEEHFANALHSLDEGKTEDALVEILRIPQYRDYSPTNELLQENANLASAIAAHEEKTAPFRTVGDSIIFGRCEQDRKKDNGPEEIEWIVLDYNADENKALLLSRYCLAAVGYHNHENEAVEWETSHIRSYLNSEFLMNAFSGTEQAAILTTDVDNGPSQASPNYPFCGSGKNTQDRIFLLSYAEFLQYVNSSRNMEARASATDYALSTDPGIYFMKWHSNSSEKMDDGKRSVEWWLRTLGSTPEKALAIDGSGKVAEDYNYIGEYFARPAFWLDLTANIF